MNRFIRSESRYRSQLKWQTPEQEFIKLGAWQLCPKRYHLLKKKKKKRETLSSNSRATSSSCCLLIEPHKTWYNIYHSYVSQVQVNHLWRTWRFVFHIYSSWLTFAHRINDVTVRVRPSIYFLSFVTRRGDKSTQTFNFIRL